MFWDACFIRDIFRFIGSFHHISSPKSIVYIISIFYEDFL
ncbi:hypothetical protein BMB171_C3670 [Bacillus thuringiensis BMB171]|nr:hypothetical protein BMB171_C3670 [Bacillus thuringiensis BMB171]